MSLRSFEYCTAHKGGRLRRLKNLAAAGAISSQRAVQRLRNNGGRWQSTTPPSDPALGPVGRDRLPPSAFRQRLRKFMSTLTDETRRRTLRSSGIRTPARRADREV